MESCFDLRFNISALAIAILREDIYIPEQAFAAVTGKKYMFTKDDSEDMLKLREQGMTYPEIAEIYGTTMDAVFKRIKKIRKNKETA